jgi:hypothetical protein
MFQREKERNLRQTHDDLEQIRIAHAIKMTKVFNFIFTDCRSKLIETFYFGRFFNKMKLKDKVIIMLLFIPI